MRNLGGGGRENCNCEHIAELYLFVYNYALGVKGSTPNDGIYAELGKFSLFVRKIQIVKFANTAWNFNHKNPIKNPEC